MVIGNMVENDERVQREMARNEKDQENRNTYK